MAQHLLRIQGIPADLGGQLHILQGGEVLHQVVELEHEADVIPAVGGQLPAGVAADQLAVHGDGALVAGVHASQDVQHRGFACAGGAYDDDELPLVHVKGDMVRRGDGDLAHLVPLDHLL